MTSSIQWESLDSETFEDLCAVLVSRMYPNSRRMEGAGGPDGRDVHIATSKGPVVYGIKKYSSRITPSLRKKIRTSITYAARYEPVKWILITPIDPTPSEIRWFEEISSEYSFPCDWYGRSWLDNTLSQYPDVSNYYLHGAKLQVSEVLRELSKESGSLARGVPDATERMKSLVQRLNELDPHYSFGVSTSAAGTTGLTIWPKYVGAEYDSPISVGSLRFPLQEKRQIANRVSAKADKENVQTDPSASVAGPMLPYELAGIGDSIEARRLTLPQIDSIDNDLDAQLRIIGNDGQTCVQLPLQVVRSSRRPRDVNVRLKDLSGSISADVNVDLNGQSMHISFRYRMPKRALPSAILPALQFLNKYCSPNAVVALIGERQIAEPVAIEALRDEQLAKLMELVSSLDDVQRRTRVYFPIPQRLQSREIAEINSVRKLLNGEAVKNTWTDMNLSSTVGALSSLKETMARGPGNVLVETELALHLEGRDIPLGCKQRITLNAAIVQWPEVPADASSDMAVEVRLLPGADRTFTTVIVRDGGK